MAYRASALPTELLRPLKLAIRASCQVGRFNVPIPSVRFRVGVRNMDKVWNIKGDLFQHFYE